MRKQFDIVGTAAATAAAVSRALQSGEVGVLFAPVDMIRYRLNIGIRTLADGAAMPITVRDAEGLVIRTVHGYLPRRSSRRQAPKPFSMATFFRGERPSRSSSRVARRSFTVQRRTTRPMTRACSSRRRPDCNEGAEPGRSSHLRCAQSSALHGTHAVANHVTIQTSRQRRADRPRTAI
jgi:hypothetical protein